MISRAKLIPLASAIALITGGWGLSHVDFPAVAHAQNSSTATQPAKTALAVPDFTALVKQHGRAVVNIRVERTSSAARSPGMPNIPGMPEAPDGGTPNIPFPFEPPIPGNPGTGPIPQQAQGSGFIISPDGYILTNAHVVANGGDITVHMTDKREYKAKLIGADRRTDVALLKIDGKNLPYVTIGDPEKEQVGEWVAAIGSPFGFENTISAGILSAKGRALPSETYVPFLQTDVAVNPGNSGGPLFNLNGEVIGINSQIYSRTGGYMGLSFAIPIDIAMDVANQLRETGKVTRGRLGVQIQNLTQDLARSFGLQQPNGALVANVEKGSAAQRAGVEPGDIILKYNGKQIVDSTDLPVLVAKTKPGTETTVTVWRGGKEQTLTIKVGELEADKTVVAAAGGPSAETGKLGLAVQDLTPQQRQQLDLKGGVIVDAAQGPAARAGIQKGDVVIAINGEQVESASQFRSLVDKAAEGKPLALLIQRGDSRIYVPVNVG